MRSDELLPDPDFGSELFDSASAEQTEECAALSPEAPVDAGTETLFPSDPFLAMHGEIAEQSEEQAPSVEPAPELPDEPIFAGDLFDPAPGTDEASTEQSLFDAPDASDTAELGSEELCVTAETEAIGTEPDAAQQSPREARRRKRKEKQPPVRVAREMTPAVIREHRRSVSASVRLGKVRFCIAAALTILLAILEIFPAFGVDVTVPLGVSRVRGAAALLDLQLVLLVAFCAWRSVLVGLRYLFGRRFRSESVLVIGLLLSVAYDLYLYISEALSPILVSLPLAIAYSSMVWIEISELQVRHGILLLLSGCGGVSIASPTEIGSQRGLEVSRVDRVDGYEEHIDDFAENSRFRGGLLLASAILAGLALLISYASGGSSYDFLAVALTVFFLITPISALLSRRMYLVRMQEALLDGNTALVGEQAAYDAAGASVFSIADTEAFASEETKIKIVNVFRDYRLDEALRLITGVYRLVGGPLYPVLEKTGGDAGEDLSLALVDVGSDGIIAHSDSRVVAIGSYDFMKKSSIVFPPEAEADPLLIGEQMCLLYCAVDGEIVARFYIEYVLSVAFEGLAEQLGKSGVSVEIRTSDPNVSEPYLTRISCLNRGVLSVRRVGCGELLGANSERRESCFFTLERPRALLGAWLAFRRYLSVRRRADAIGVCQLLLGLSIFGVAAFGVGVPLVPVSLAALYHALSTLLLIRASLGFRRRISAEISDGEESGDRQPQNNLKGTL